MDPARVLVVPIGSVEQHGPHLPLNTDTVIAEALAAALCDDVDGFVLGDATTASAADGLRRFEAMRGRLATAAQTWREEWR